VNRKLKYSFNQQIPTCIHGERFGTRAQMRAIVFEYIEVDYNRQRRHSTLGYISPESFELRMSA
ncbi:Integrase core domain-containing protein, partial [Azotobacter beijerinckii]